MKQFPALFLSFILLFGIHVQAEEIEEPQGLYAQSAVLMDADSGRVLFSKNGEEIMAMASTTKIMTCIITLEEGTLEDTVTVSENAAAQPKVHLGMNTGEQFVLRDLLYSLMLESHNDSAVAIAEHVAGTVEAFADKMNDKAAKLGCESTHFVTPNGLDASDEGGSHSTTATDLARIMSYCITQSPKKEVFLEITSKANYSFSDVEGNRSFSCTNRNSFLSMMEGAISGKTGFTGKAGYCYVGAVERDGRTFVVALLACGWPNNKNYKWKDTQKLMEYAIENYTYRNVYDEVELPEVEVKGGIPEDSNLYGKAYTQLIVDTEDDKLEVLLRSDEQVEVKTEYQKELSAPVIYGKEVGNISYYLNGEEICEYPIIVEKSVEKKDLPWYFNKILEIYLGLAYD